MKKIIQFNISKDDKYYVAEGINIPAVTQGETLDEAGREIIKDNRGNDSGNVRISD